MIDPVYSASENRYSSGMQYRRCGRSGVLFPAISLGLWHNFGDVDTLSLSQKKIHYAFDHGICHFDLANNYGPSFGSAEETFGRVMQRSMAPYRDEMFISTKAGYNMWPGPYGEWGSRKYLMASINQSLKRMNVDYVDLFYSHRYDPDTPLDETLQALVDIVRQGKALYVGISNYPKEAADYAYEFLKREHTPALLYQGKFNMLHRDPVTSGILQSATDHGTGFIAFSPLAQGLLTDRYLNGIPADSRIGRGGYLKKEALTPELLHKIAKLNEIAIRRGQTLAEMSLSWLLSHEQVTSVLVGASSVDQIADNLKALANLTFTPEQFAEIDRLTAL